jgi:hypothetical protein
MMKGMHLTQNGSNSSSVQVLLWSIGLWIFQDSLVLKIVRMPQNVEFYLNYDISLYDLFIPQLGTGIWIKVLRSADAWH